MEKYAECTENTEEAIQAAMNQFLADPNAYPYSLEEGEKWVWEHDVSAFGKRLTALLEQC